MKRQRPDDSYNDYPSQSAIARRARERRTQSPPCTPPAHFHEELKVPYLKIRGQWLRQMGFNVGRKLQIEACAGVITIKLLGPPAVEDPRVPRFVERTIYHGEINSESGQFVPEDVIQ